MKNRYKIGINTLFWLPGKVGGTEIFLKELLLRSHSTLIFTNKENDAYIKSHCPKSKIYSTGVRATNRLHRLFYELFVLPIICQKQGINLLHSPGYTSPLWGKFKKVTTVFDLNYYYYPEDFDSLTLLVMKILIPLVIKFSDRIIVHTQTSKADLIKITNVNDSKVSIVTAGISTQFLKSKSKKYQTVLLERYGIKKPYFLLNASSHPHKNNISAIKAFNIFQQKNKACSLVILGIPGRSSLELVKYIKQHQLQEKIHITGWVDRDHVPVFFNNCIAFLFPSLYEGFGLPLIEAMACGVPVIASNVSCIPEVTGKAALLINSLNINEFYVAMDNVTQNNKLRKLLINRGRIRVKSFSWEKMYDQTLKVYNNLLT